LRNRFAQLATIVACLAFTLPACAWTPVENLDVIVSVNPDGSAVVIERFSGAEPLSVFERRMRVASAGPWSRHMYLVDVVEVQDAAGHDLPYTVRTTGGILRIRVHNAARFIKITYGVSNAVKFLADHDELLWNIGDVQPNRLGSVSVQMLLPDAATGQFQLQSFLRRDVARTPKLLLWSSDGRVPTRVTANTIRVGSPGAIVPGVTLVTNVFFNKGLLQQPGWLTRAQWFAESNPVLMLPIVAWLLMTVVRFLKWRRADPRRSIVPLYDPPEDLSPAEAGVLIDDSFDPRDVTATLLDLAVRGYVAIEEAKPAERLLPDCRDYKIRLLRPHEQWGELRAHERIMLFQTFYGGHWTLLSSLQLRFYPIVAPMRSAVMYALRRKGYYRVDPSRAQLARQYVHGVFAVAIFALHVTGLMPVFDSPVLGGAMVALSAVIVYVMGRTMTAKTLAGMQAYVAVRGFEEFMTTVAADRLRRDPGAFERHLPYAVALGVEHRWADAFRGIAVQEPGWYEFADKWVFDSALFNRRLQALSASTLQALRRIPRNPASVPPPPAPPEKTAAGTA
jgi:hypothetical protein